MKIMDSPNYFCIFHCVMFLVSKHITFLWHSCFVMGKHLLLMFVQHYINVITLSNVYKRFRDVCQNVDPRRFENIRRMYHVLTKTFETRLRMSLWHFRTCHKNVIKCFDRLLSCLTFQTCSSIASQYVNPRCFKNIGRMFYLLTNIFYWRFMMLLWHFQHFQTCHKKS